MVINDEVLSELKDSAGNQRQERAKEILEEKKVKITKVTYENKNNFSIHARVNGRLDNYNTYIEIKNGEIENLSCTCPDYESTYGTCKHILATALELEENPSYIKLFGTEEIKINKTTQKNKEKYRIYRQMISSFYIDEQEDNNIKYVEEKIKIEPRLIYKENLKTFRLEVRIGNKQMYKIKNLPDFYTRMVNKENYKYGSKLEFMHVRENFDEDSQRLLDYVLKYAEIIKFANESEERYLTNVLDNAYIVVSNSGLDELFDILKGKEVEIYSEYSTERVQFVDNKPNIKYSLKEKNDTEYELETNIDIFNYIIIQGKEYSYLLQDDKLYRC